MPINGIPTKEELILIRDSVLLPMLLSVAESKRRKREWQAEFAERVMEMITAELRRVKEELRAAKIKVWEEDRIDFAVYYRFNCRGYEDTFGLMKFVVKSELRVRLQQYMKRL